MVTESPKCPSVIVGISTHNRADALRKSISSALHQSYRPLRVAVIDDASTDETPSVRTEFPEVLWERWEQNRGYVQARNKIMLSASEDYYVSLDDDAWFLRNDEIGIAVKYLENHPNVAAVAFDILSPNEPMDRARGRKWSVGWFIGCGHILRLSHVLELKGYSEFPGNYGVEEVDLCLRLIDSGYDIVRLDGVHVWHDKTMTARDVARQVRSSVSNDLTLAILRYPNGLLIPVVVWKIISNWLFGLRRGLLTQALQGLWDVSRTFHISWRARSPVRCVTIARFRSLSRVPCEVIENGAR